MAEGPEHAFLGREFLRVLQHFSRLRLYGFQESERKRLDFSCVLQRSWSRNLIGQTVWGNTRGVDKDLRLLLLDRESHIKAYVARDTVKTRSLLHEAVSDYRRSGRFEDLYQLKVFWIPADFDADDATQRTSVRSLLRTAIVRDVLFNVVFGNLQARDVLFFLETSGYNVNLAMLNEIADSEHGLTNVPWMAARLGVGTRMVRERMHILRGAAFVDQTSYITPRGLVFLDLAERVASEVRQMRLSPEMKFILRLLGVGSFGSGDINWGTDVPDISDLDWQMPVVSPWVKLLWELEAASGRFPQYKLGGSVDAAAALLNDRRP